MAMDSKSAGSKIELDDLKAWYDKFTTFSNNYGTSSTKPTMSNTTKPVAADYNTLVNIVEKYRADAYLKTVTWPNPTPVSSGTLLTISTAKNALNAIKNVQSTVKCRNTMNYANATHGHGTGNSVSERDSESYYNEGHISLSNTYYNCCQGRYFYSSGSSYTHSNGTKTNESVIDVRNAKTSGTK